MKKEYLKKVNPKLIQLMATEPGFKLVYTDYQKYTWSGKRLNLKWVSDNDDYDEILLTHEFSHYLYARYVMGTDSLPEYGLGDDPGNPVLAKVKKPYIVSQANELHECLVCAIQSFISYHIVKTHDIEYYIDIPITLFLTEKQLNILTVCPRILGYFDRLYCNHFPDNEELAREIQKLLKTCSKLGFDHINMLLD